MTHNITMAQVRQAGGIITIDDDEKTYNYRVIQASQARDYDGTKATWQAGTPEGDRECLEQECIRKSDGKTTYSSGW